MEFVHGCKINNINCLKEKNIDPVKGAQLLIECFSQQIYKHGFIHSDPHPGNLLLRKQDDLTQLVLLDHGLYKVFPEKLRIWYCKLWRALILRKNEDIDKYGKKLGCQQYSHVFALLLTFRPPSNKDIGLENKLTEKDFEEIRKMFKGNTLEDNLKIASKLLESLPREILFVLRTTNLLHSINKDLGGVVNRFAIMARTSLDGLQTREKGGWWRSIKVMMIKMEFEFKLQLFSFVAYLVRILGPWWVLTYFY